MEFYRGITTSTDGKTYKTKVWISERGEEVTARSLSPTFADLGGAGFYSIPVSTGSSCIIMKDGESYWLMGYYNEISGLDESGFIVSDNFPITSLGLGDTIWKHSVGNYIHQGENFVSLNQGLNAAIKLEGGLENSFTMNIYKMYIDNSAGKISWVLDSNDSSLLSLAIKKEYELLPLVSPSDITNINIGNIPGGDHIFELETLQYPGIAVASSRTYLSLSKDTDGYYMRLALDDLTLGASMQFDVLNAHDVRWGITDALHTSNINLMGSSGYEYWMHDAVYEKLIDFQGNKTETLSGDYVIVGNSIHLGAYTPGKEQPLVLGNKLIDLLEEFADIIISSKHFHPQGPTTGLFPTSIKDIQTWKVNLKKLLSDIAWIEK